jgi:peptide/nickel transport system substrate-binding protein
MEVAMRWLVPFLLALVACAPSASPGGEPGQNVPDAAARAVPQRALVMASAFEPELLDATFGRGSGTTDFGTLGNAYLSYLDYPYKVMPYLAAELPSVEAGTWRLFPDGRMETTYRLRPNLRFHDGTPMTAADFAFAFRVRTDPAVPAPRADAEPYASTVRVIDDHTMVIEWKRAYIWAAEIPIPSFTPIPRHLLEEQYLTDPGAILNSPHWRDAFIGSGPFRLERWEPGVQIVYHAFEGFVFGKPPIDQLTVRFITDANVVVANLLSGTVDMAYSATIHYPHAEILIQNQWPGQVQFFLGSSPRYVHFQMRDWGNTQRAVHDVRVRRAMLHAVDRQSIVDLIYEGRTVGMHVWLHPTDPSYPAVDRAITKYPYDLNRAQALLEEAGWRKGGDGVLRNAAGEPLNMHILAHSGRVEEQETEVLASAWRSLGMPLEISWLTPAQMRDGEYRSKFPAVTYDRRSIDMAWTSDQLSLPENRWGLSNRNGYVNPRLDELWDRVMTTIPFQERERFMVEAYQVMTADAAVIPTHLQPRIFAHPARLSGIKEAVPASNSLAMSWEWRWQ